MYTVLEGIARRRLGAAQGIERRQHAAGTAVEYVRVDHRRVDVGMTEQLLDRADVLPALQQMRGERMAQRVRADGFEDCCGHRGPFDRAYTRCSRNWSRSRVERNGGGWLVSMAG